MQTCEICIEHTNIKDWFAGHVDEHQIHIGGPVRGSSTAILGTNIDLNAET